MVERARISLQHWPAQVRLSVGLLSGAIVVAGLYLALIGIPKSVPPSANLFETVDTERALAESRPELNSSDFISRPLFSTRRRAPASPQKVDSSDPGYADPAGGAALVGTMEGSHLLGIFVSGEVEGAIVRLDNGQRHRLLIGDALDGWTLQSVSAREIRFVSDAGEAADLDMVLSQSQQPLVQQKARDMLPERETVKRDAEIQSQEQAVSENEEAAKTESFTFESMYSERFKGKPLKERGVGVEKP